MLQRVRCCCCAVYRACSVRRIAPPPRKPVRHRDRKAPDRARSPWHRRLLHIGARDPPSVRPRRSRLPSEPSGRVRPGASRRGAKATADRRGIRHGRLPGPMQDIHRDHLGGGGGCRVVRVSSPCAGEPTPGRMAGRAGARLEMCVALFPWGSRIGGAGPVFLRLRLGDPAGALRSATAADRRPPCPERRGRRGGRSRARDRRRRAAGIP